MRPQYVIRVLVVEQYKLIVDFADGARRRVDLEPHLYGPVFEPLRDPACFQQATVDPIAGTVVWPNGADVSPEFLYAGESVADALPDTSEPTRQSVDP